MRLKKRPETKAIKCRERSGFSGHLLIGHSLGLEGQIPYQVQNGTQVNWMGTVAAWGHDLHSCLKNSPEPPQDKGSLYHGGKWLRSASKKCAEQNSQAPQQSEVTNKGRGGLLPMKHWPQVVVTFSLTWSQTTKHTAHTLFSLNGNSKLHRKALVTY